MSTVLVTGANRGIGLSLVKHLVARGDTVVATSRRASPELAALGVRVEIVDVADDASVAALDARLGALQLDLLVNNAGILSLQRLDSLDWAAMRAQFEVNALGPLRVTAALRHRLRPGAKVGIVTSRMGSISDNTSGSAYGYRMSKAAVNAAGKSLALDLAPAGVAVVLLHPGYVRTDMTGGRGNWGPDESAAGLLVQLDRLTLETTGSFWHANGEALPW